MLKRGLHSSGIRSDVNNSAVGRWPSVESILTGKRSGSSWLSFMIALLHLLLSPCVTRPARACRSRQQPLHPVTTHAASTNTHRTPPLHCGSRLPSPSATFPSKPSLTKRAT
jgi:hypothetical protein